MLAKRMEEDGVFVFHACLTEMAASSVESAGRAGLSERVTAARYTKDIERNMDGF